MRSVDMRTQVFVITSRREEHMVPMVNIVWFSGTVQKHALMVSLFVYHYDDYYKYIMSSGRRANIPIGVAEH